MAQKATLTIDFSFIADPGFKSKLPILLILVVLFAFAGVMFARTGLGLGDLFDVPRYELNAAKLCSLSFIMFVILFAITISLSVIYGHGLTSGGALVELPLLAIVSLALYIVSPSLLGPFLIMAAAAATAAFAGSRKEKITFSSAWSASSKAMAVMLLLLFAYVAFSLNASKDQYFDTVLAGAVELSPQLKQGVGSVCSSAIFGALEQNLNEQTLADQLRSSISRDTLRSDLLSAAPLLAVLNSTQQDALVDAAYNVTARVAIGALPALKQSLETALAPNETAEEPAQGATPEQIASLKEQVLGFPAAKTLYDYFPLLAALLVVSVAYVGKYVIQAISSIVCALVVRL
ncbi:MAG: hypothetical protein NTY90_03445 [Candidatus Micrarchaeota archaeon]|nr:hypothetical protein [Candidatus Micrarchaeota archaeon]